MTTASNNLVNATRHGEEVGASCRTPTALLSATVEAAKRGDSLAWNELVRRHTSLVWSVARGCRLRDCDAADVVQNTWIRAFEKLESVREPARFAGWLAVIAKRESLAALRRMSVEVPAGDALPEFADPSTGPESAAIRAAEHKAVEEAIDELSDRSRRFVHELFFGRAESYSEMAQLLSIPVGSIGPTRGRVLRRLRDQLARTGFESIGASC